MRLPRKLAVALALIAAAATGGCGAGHDPAGTSAQPGRIVIATPPAVAAAALYIAERQGLFARQGLVVIVKSDVASGGALIPQLLHGDSSIAAGQWTSFAAADAAGVAQLREVATGWANGPGVIRIVSLPGSGITTPAQLRRKTIAVNVLGGEAQLMAEASLAEHGVPPSSVRFVAIPFQSMLAALAAHRIDAAFTMEPYTTEARLDLGVRTIIDCNTGADRGLPVVGYVATSQWLAQHHAAAAAFTRAMEQAQRIAASDPAAVRSAVAAAAGIRPQVARQMALGTFPLVTGPGQLQRVVTLMRQYGQLRQPLDARELTGQASAASP